MRQSFISKHIVLSSSICDTIVSGIILILDDLIYDVVVYDISTSVLWLLERYELWNPQDLSDFYISPGVIDMNTRMEWESFAELTKAAVAGGTTFALVEEGHFAQSTPAGELFCDVGKIEILTEELLSKLQDVDEGEYFGVKAYLFAPYKNVLGVSDHLSTIFEKFEMSEKILIIDPTLPDERMLHSVSPYRFKKIEKRLRLGITENHSFSGAFPDMIEDNGENSENSSYSEESPLDNTKIVQENSLLESPFQIKNKNSSDTHCLPEIIESIFLANDPTSESPYAYRSIPLAVEEKDELKISESAKQNKYNLKSLAFGSSENFFPEVSSSGYQKSSTENDLDHFDKKIKKSQMLITNLSLAEMSTYNSAGVTRFSIPNDPSPIAHPKSPLTPMDFHKSSSLTPTLTNQLALSPSSASLFQRRNISSSFTVVVKSIMAAAEVKHSYYMASYSDTWEVTGIDKVLRTLKSTKSRIHISNISAVRAFNRLRKVKSLLPQITCEIPASHLHFNSESVPDNDTRFKCSPPIRSQSNRSLLWELVKMNTIDTITSNHCCIHPDYKNVDNRDFRRSLNGMNTAGFTLQAVWSILNANVGKVSQKDTSIVLLAKWLSFNPAKILGVDSVRGSIEKGKYADLVVWKPFEESILNQDYSPFSKISPFIGKQLSGKIYKVILRGNLAFEHGVFQSLGKFVR